MTLPQFRLPAALEACQWPFPRTLKPFYSEVRPESVAWLESFRALEPAKQKAFIKSDSALLACLGYPFLGREQVRIGCDLMTLFFIFDEYTDNADGNGVRAYVEIVLDAIAHPHRPRPDGEHILGEIARQFWELVIKTASPLSKSHFVKTFSDFAEAVIEEAGDRVSGRVRGIDDYLALRRRTAATSTMFFPCELGVNLPDEVIFHPYVANMARLVAESMVLTNDAYSYNIEQAAGHEGHNIITVVSRELQLNLGQALEWVEKYHTDILTQFLKCRDDLPSFGEYDALVREYINNITQIVRGLDAWSFESGRYFGSKGLEIQKYRMVDLLPRVKADLVSPMMAAAAAGAESDSIPP